MDYSITLLKIEVFFLAVSLLYILYYSFDKILFALKRIYEMIPKSRQRHIQENPQNIVEINEDKNLHVKEYEDNGKTFTDEEKLRLSELIKKIRLNISIGEYDIAKNLVVEWLVIDKFNIEINTELAQIYMLEKDYHKAEYIYKDLLLVHDEHFDTLKKLGYVLAVQEKYELSLEVYKKAYEINPQDDEVVNMLAHLCYHNEFYYDSIEYLKIFLKNIPRDVENLILLWACYRAVGEINESIFAYTKVLEIQPYNEAVKEEIESLYELAQRNTNTIVE